VMYSISTLSSPYHNIIANYFKQIGDIGAVLLSVY